MGERDRSWQTSERLEAIRSGLERREGAHDPTGMRGLERIEIEVVGGLEYEARNPHEPAGSMRIGEPVERGGTGRGSSPLSHFLTGTAACLLNQFVRIGAADGLDLAFDGATARGEFRRESGGAFQRIACEIRASGAIAPADADRLIERAERLCYVHCTLSRVVEMTTILVVDGREEARRTTGPTG